MSNARKHPKVPETQHTPHPDSVKPPPDLPDTSPLDRMKELTRRVVSVRKDDMPKGRTT